MKLRHIFAFGSFALAAYACGGNSSLGAGGGGLNSGGTGGTDPDGGAFDPCSGKVCGAECSLCPPNDLECAETAVLKYCDPSGRCGQAYPQCPPSAACSTDKDCPQMGAPCEQCPDGSFACPSVQCVNGACVGSFQTCSGSVCQSAADCPQVDAPCSPCPDGSVSCPWTECVNGTCVTGINACGGYQSCANRACGSPCSVCDPADRTCAETTVLKYCDATGICSPTVPDCGGGMACRSDAECPVVDCAREGACPEYKCIGGTCQAVWPSTPDPVCNVAADCPAAELCMQCRSGACAEMDCINGACQWVCR